MRQRNVVSRHEGKGRPEPGTGYTSLLIGRCKAWGADTAWLSRIKVFFKKHNGELIREVEGNEGDDMVDLSWEWDLDIEGMSPLPSCPSSPILTQMRRL